MKNINYSEIICPICNSKSTKIFKTINDIDCYECINCEHLFTPVSKLMQGVCERYDNIQSESDNFISTYGDRNKLLLKLFLQEVPPKINNKYNMLDFGAGNAHISRIFKKVLGENVDITCVEANPHCVDIYPKFGLNYVDSLENLDPNFDIIYLVEVIEHIEDPVSLLKKLGLLLNSDGKIFISTPLGSKYNRNSVAFQTKSHLHFFNEKSLNLAMELSGLEPIKYRYYYQLYPLPLKFRLITKLTRITKAKIREYLSLYFNINRVGHLVGFTKRKNKC